MSVCVRRDGRGMKEGSRRMLVWVEIVVTEIITTI